MSSIKIKSFVLRKTYLSKTKEPSSVLIENIHDTYIYQQKPSIHNIQGILTTH